MTGQPPMLRALKYFDEEDPFRRKALRQDISVRFLSRPYNVRVPVPLAGDHAATVADYVAAPTPLVELRNGALIAAEGFVFTEHNELLRESVERLAYRERISASWSAMGRALAEAPAESHSVPVAVLASQRSANYFHWWIDVLPRIWAIRASYVEPCRFAVAARSGFQGESLRLLGESETITLDRPVHRFHKLLFVSGLTIGSSQAINPGVAAFAQWCRDRIGVAKTERRSRKLFLSRKGARSRRLLNEAEVLKTLGSDFEAVDLESVSVTSQASLFAEARVIVAPHGAGIVNMLFCTAPTPLVELVHADHPPDTYRRLSAALGHPYIAVGCDPQIRKAGRPSHRDITAPVSSVAAAVKSVCREATPAGE